MRHNRKVNHLGRKSEHREAMLANMASSLIIHKRISTTVAKAKALRKYVEPLITKSKEDSTQSRRLVFSYLQDKKAVAELFRDIAVKIATRPGGYTRILKTGPRLGDNAEMCMMELVDFNENLLAEKEQKTAKTTRRRRGAGTSKKIDEVKINTEPKAKTKVEDKVVEEKTEVEELSKDQLETETPSDEPKVEDNQDNATEEKKEE